MATLLMAAILVLKISIFYYCHADPRQRKQHPSRADSPRECPVPCGRRPARDRRGPTQHRRCGRTRRLRGPRLPHRYYHHHRHLG